jgi:hypothetical protein
MTRVHTTHSKVAIKITKYGIENGKVKILNILPQSIISNITMRFIIALDNKNTMNRHSTAIKKPAPKHGINCAQYPIRDNMPKMIRHIQNIITVIIIIA